MKRRFPTLMAAAVITALFPQCHCLDVGVRGGGTGVQTVASSSRGPDESRVPRPTARGGKVPIAPADPAPDYNSSKVSEIRVTSAEELMPAEPVTLMPDPAPKKPGKVKPQGYGKRGGRGAATPEPPAPDLR